jgi:hypothetical protein
MSRGRDGRLGTTGQESDEGGQKAVRKWEMQAGTGYGWCVGGKGGGEARLIGS